MNYGFNSNVRVGDAIYHVQTEDRGPSHPFLDTVVYLAGRVVYKRSTNYESFARLQKPGTLAQKLHEKLAEQHRNVIAGLEAGTLDLNSQKKAQPAADAAGARDGLELRLTNPKTWFAAGNVVLQIELSESKSKKPVGGADVQACLERGKELTTCATTRTDAKGLATLQFPIPPSPGDGASLVIRATSGARFGELRFRLKAKAKAPVPVAR